MGAPTTFTMQAPGATALWTMADRTGKQWTADANGAIAGVTLAALPDLSHAGCTLLLGGALTSGAGPKYGENAATTGATATSASISGAGTVTLAMTGTLGAGAALTLPTAAVLVPLAEGAADQTESWRLRVINRSSANYAWTVTTAAGWTLTGTMSIAQNTWREFDVTAGVSAGTAFATMQAVGTGTDS